MSKLDLGLVRNKESFMKKKKHTGTNGNYHSSINNFENFCMERFGKADIIESLKKNSDMEVLDFIQSWIDWNDKLNPSTVLNMFSRIKKYLHHRGIKLHPQDIKEELEFRRASQEELYPLTLENIQSILKEMRHKNKVLFICQLSSLMRIGEMVQLKKKHLILEHKNIIAKLPPTITKFSKGRTTFFSKEASKLLRPMLKSLGDDDLIFATNHNVRHAEINTEQILNRVLDKIGLGQRYESNGRYKINTHSFRAYGITKLSRHDPNFTKKIAGQKGYLLQYDRMDDEKKLELYQKFEVDLIIDNTEKLKLENQMKDRTITELEENKATIQKLKKNQDNITKTLDMMVTSLWDKTKDRDIMKEDIEQYKEIIALRLDNDPQYAQVMKELMLKRPGIPEELKKRINRI